MPKILGGFVDYRSENSRTRYGNRLEWGTYYEENQLQGISHTSVASGFCKLDKGHGFCGQYLVISSNITETAKGYDIKGSYVKFIDDGSVTMRWGISSAGPGLNDTIVTNVKIASEGSANLHFILEEIEGASQFCFSVQQCGQSSCLDMVTKQPCMVKNTSVSHQLISDFRCWNAGHIRCDLYIWI